MSIELRDKVSESESIETSISEATKYIIELLETAVNLLTEIKNK